jgi:hypothetical protein
METLPAYSLIFLFFIYESIVAPLHCQIFHPTSTVTQEHRGSNHEALRFCYYYHSVRHARDRGTNRW